jgi:hypothetical protein
LGAFLALKVKVKLPSTLGLKYLNAKKKKKKSPIMNGNVFTMGYG